MASTQQAELDQEAFADILLKLQIHSALVTENVQNNKSPLPLLAQSCSLLDNLTSSPYWTAAQVELVRSLRIDTWAALANGCIQAKDWVQAEAALQRLASLQDAECGPLSWKATQKKQNKRKGSPHSSGSTVTSASAGTSVHSSSSVNASGTRPLTNTTTLLPDSDTPTEAHLKSAQCLLRTLELIQQVFEEMGKHDMANNYERRRSKLQDRILS